MRYRLLALVMLSLLPVGVRGGAYQDILIRGVPHIRQKPDFCGEAAAAMYLQKLGRQFDQDGVFDHAGVDPMLARGAHTADLTRALKHIGFATGAVWYKVGARDAGQMEGQFAALHADLVKGVPSIVCMHYDDRPGTTEHFRLVLGYDADTDQVIYHEPAQDRGAYLRMKRQEFVNLWPLKYSDNVWTVIRIRLEPGRILLPKRPEGLTDADYAQHMMALKKRLPSRGFTIVLERPFVVIGDESPPMVKSRARRTVKWAVDRLKRQYFKKDPNHIIDIWLFKNKGSYEKYTRELFNDRPTTPFGYYSASERALVMNIATGGGTLVHEIVHPFMAVNFPECPAWFNEGLGSLYEQSGARGGRIVGLTNWRLAGLQRAIRKDVVPSFEQLTGTSEHQFYAEDLGTNYAQARYLCYYLQEKGLLKEYYHQFAANHKNDPSGYQTLQKVLGNPDMAAFKKQWEKFALGLEYP